MVRKAVADSGVKFVLQEEQRGTGHALMVGARKRSLATITSSCYPEMRPLITVETITELRDFHLQKKAAMTFAVGRTPESDGGMAGFCVKVAKSDEVKAIVEEKSASPSRRKAARNQTRASICLPSNPFTPASGISRPTTRIVSTT